MGGWRIVSCHWHGQPKTRKESRLRLNIYYFRSPELPQSAGTCLSGMQEGFRSAVDDARVPPALNPG